ncbi:MAG: glycosyltransferase [Firmicutes bacterium]|nr:glycosyltransferase [Bacillota bacterium]
MDILCLSTSNYYPFPTRKQNVMNRMEDCRVIFVDPPVTYIAPIKDKKTLERISAYKKGGQVSGEHPHVKIYAAPPVMPFYNKKRSINKANQKKLAKWLAGIVKENGFSDDFVLWCYSPSSCDVVEPLAKALGQDPEHLWKRTVYDCVDRHSAYPGMIDPAVVDGQEEDLAKNCAAVFATARGLYDRLKEFNQNCHLIPNGANYELFSSTAGLKKEGVSPHFGFVGMLQECIDYDILKKVAESFPDGKLTLIGRSLPGVDLSWMKGIPNVEYAGLIPQTELPGRIKDFDVCLNVFADNELSRDVSPLKFYEYLATGKPVVSTPVPIQVNDYADCVYIAKQDPEDFVEKCRKALNEAEDSPMKARRLEKGRECSWDERVRLMRNILASGGIR